MKKGEEYFCDICNKPRRNQCLICGQDLCEDHSVEISVHLCEMQPPGFVAYLCPCHAQPLLPILHSMLGKSVAKDSGDWLATGHDGTYNEKKLQRLVKFLSSPPGVIERGEDV